jgi:methyltransferase-like protein
VELFTQPPNFTLEVHDRPVASPLARLQAQAAPRVTNLRHDVLTLDEVSRQLVAHLDGSRDRGALREVLTGLVAEGDLAVEEAGQSVREPVRVREFADKTVDRHLPDLARQALLVS